MQIRFTRSSRRHKIGRTFAIEALRDAGEPREMENGDLLWIGTDSRGVEYEIIGFVAAEDPDLVLIKHVMPLHFRKEGYWE